MGSSRSSARYGAESLRIALVAKLQANRGDLAARERIFAGIQLCDKFLSSSAHSAAALQVLKEEVKKSFWQQGTRRSLPNTPRVPSATGLQGRLLTQQSHNSNYGTKASTPARATPLASVSRINSKASDDYMLPNHLLHAKAYVRGGEYDRLIMKQDAIAQADIELEKQQRQESIKAVKRTLDEQMQHVEKRRQEHQWQKACEAEEVKQSIVQFQREEQERIKQQQEKSAATRRLYTEQAEERRIHVQQQKMLEHKWIEEERARLREIQEKEVTAQAAQREAAQRKMLAFKAEQEVVIQEKKKKKAAQQQEDREYNRQYMQMLENWETTRERQAADRAERTRLRSIAGGAEALQKGREELERLDEERANRLQAEYEAKMQEQGRQKRLKQQQETQRRLEILAQQMAEKAAQEEALRQEAVQVKEEASRVAREAKQKEAEDKVLQRQRQQLTLLEQRNAIKEASRRKFADYVGVMSESEKRLQAPLLSGKQRGVAAVYGRFHVAT